MGLATAVNRLKDSRAKSKVIILLTDGVNNSGFIDPKIAAELAVEFQIKTYTIGLGSNGNARAPIGILGIFPLFLKSHNSPKSFEKVGRKC